MAIIKRPVCRKYHKTLPERMICAQAAIDAKGCEVSILISLLQQPRIL
jgi:hypothetical protein